MYFCVLNIGIKASSDNDQELSAVLEHDKTRSTLCFQFYRIPCFCDESRTEATFSLTAAAAVLFLSRLGWQHRDLGAGLLDKLLQVHLPQLLGQQLQLMLHVLQ